MVKQPFTSPVRRIQKTKLCLETCHLPDDGLSRVLFLYSVQRVLSMKMDVAFHILKSLSSCIQSEAYYPLSNQCFLRVATGSWVGLVGQHTIVD